MVGKTGNVAMVKKIVFHRENLITDVIPQLCGIIRKNLRQLVYKFTIKKGVLIYMFSGKGVRSS